MTENYRKGFKRKLSVFERSLIMLPYHIIMVVRISGCVDSNRLLSVINKLRIRHALLAVRILFDECGDDFFLTESVPEFNLRVIPRQNEDQWAEIAEMELKIPFEIDNGPLTRFTLINSSDISELIICSHHCICDGMSLIYLIKDIFENLNAPKREIEVLPDPPIINNETVALPQSINPFTGIIVSLLNRLWDLNKHKFDSNDIKRLNEIFWEKNSSVKLLTWTLSEQITEALISRSKKEKVTVNSTLCTAFLRSQYDIQTSLKNSQKVTIPVNTRDKLLVPVGESFGFYASAITVDLQYDINKDFWDNARDIHRIILTELDQTDFFQMLSADMLSPSLLESLYFTKYGLFKSRISKFILKQWGWDHINYDFNITNMGRLNIPTKYGQLRLDQVYSPFTYSDINEKVISVITTNDKITFSMTYDQKNISIENAEKMKEKTIKYLSSELGLK